MAKVIRVLAVLATSVVALFMLGLVFAFGTCEGWKDTGTCPRDPLWDWEVFWLGFWAGVLPTLALRLGRGRIVRGSIEAIVIGPALASLLVVITGT